MAFFSVHNVKISGIAAAVPKQVVSNRDYELFDDSEKRLFIKTTGIEERRLAPKGLTTSDLCFEAAEKLLADLQWDREEISVLIFVSQSPDYYLPATSVILQDRLGLPKSCMAFDIGLGCSGYVYGLSVIANLLSNSGFKKGLLMVGDVSSATCAISDKSTYPLFGDAGTVTALEFDANADVMNFELCSDGSGKESIMIPDGGIRNLVSPESFNITEIEPGIARSKLNVALNGLDVFNFSVRDVPKTIKAFMHREALEVDDIDYFVMHQANKLMNETIRKKMKFSIEQTPYSIHKYGNTSSASIPLTIVNQLKEVVQQKNKHLLLSGFGVGLSWGVANVIMSNVHCPDIIEV